MTGDDAERFDSETENGRSSEAFADQPTLFPAQLGTDSTAGSVDQAKKQGIETDAENPKQSSVPLEEATLKLDNRTTKGVSSNVRVSKPIRIFGGYELLDEIARGGMGVVFRARQVKLNRIVALKMILTGQLASEEDVTRFKTEAEAAANLDHPGIVPIFEIGESDGQHYFSMGFVEGQSLAALVGSGPLKADRAAELTYKISDAMGYAHQQDVIHRDLKPANILLDGGGQPKVTDFGLAKKTSADSNLTGTGQILGTPSYMAPEQASGNVDQVGPLADVYAIGAILYCLVTGRPPFQSSSPMDTLLQVLEKDPVPPRQLNPSVPADIETICLKCLSKDPAKRYSSAEALKDELFRFISGEPILARPVTRIERGWRWVRRHPMMAGLSAAVLGLTALLAIGGPLIAINQASLRRQAIANETLAKDSERRAVDNERRAKQLAESESASRLAAEAGERALAQEKQKSDHALYARSVALAYEQLRSANLTNAEDMLASLSVPLRSFEWSYVYRLCKSELQSFSGLGNIPRTVAFAGGSNQVLGVARGESNLLIWSEGRERPTSVRELKIIALSDDGELLAYVDPAAPKTVKIIRPITGEHIGEFQSEATPISLAKFGGPKNSILISPVTDQTVRAWNIVDGHEILRIDNPGRQQLFPVAISPNGQYVGWRRADDGIIELRAVSGAEVLYEGSASRRMVNWQTPIAFSPDSQTFAVGGYGFVELRSVPSGDLISVMDGSRGRTYSLAFSPEGKRLAVAAEDGSIRLYETVSGRMLSIITGHGVGPVYGITSLNFDHTGDRLVSGGADLRVKVWDAWSNDKDSLGVGNEFAQNGSKPSQMVDYITSFDKPVEGLAISESGNLLAVACSDNSLKVFQTKSDKVVRQWELESAYCTVDLDEAKRVVVAGAGTLLDDQPGTVISLDLETGNELWRNNDATGPVRKVKFFDEGRKVAIAVGSQSITVGELFVLDAETGTQIWKSSKVATSIRDMDVSPDGKMIVTVGGNFGVEWSNAETGEYIASTGGRPFYSVAFSQDGAKIVAGGIDWSVRLFDQRGEREVWNQIRHSGVVFDLAFADGDRRIVSTSIDGTTRVWDTTYGDLILTMEDDGEEKYALAVSPSGNLIASSGENPVVIIRRADRSDDLEDSNSEVWTDFLVDSFDRSELGDNWKIESGSCKLADNQLEGQFAPNATIPNLLNVEFDLARVLPGNSDISFDVKVDSPTALEVKWSNPDETSSISAVFIGIRGINWNRGEPGLSILSMSPGETIQEVASRRGEFDFSPGRTYKIRTRRDGNRIQCFVDDALYRETEIDVSTPLPVLTLQALSFTPDSKIYFSNLTIKVPQYSETERLATELVVSLKEQTKLMPLLREQIAKMPADAVLAKTAGLGASDGISGEQIREAALEVAATWQQDLKEVLEETFRTASASQLGESEYQVLQRWLEANVLVPTEETNRILAMTAYRAGDSNTAWNATKQSASAHAKQYGSKHPIDIALATLLLKRDGKKDVARLGAMQLRELVRAEHWKNDPDVSQWVTEVYQHLGAEELDANFEKLLESTWDWEHSLRLHGDVQEMEDSLSDDVLIAFRRVDAGNDPHQVTANKTGWIESETLWSKGSRYGVKLVREKADIRQSENGIVITSHFVQEMEQGFYAWIQEDHFSGEETTSVEEWKLVRRVSRPSRMRFGNQLYDLVRDGWSKLDAEVEQAKDLSAKVAALRLAHRHQEAFEAAQQSVVATNSAQRFVELFRCAYGVKDYATMLSAVRKAVEIDAMVNGGPMVRALATEFLRSEQPVELGGGVSVRPPSFYKLSSNELLSAAAQGTATWSPTNDSLVGLTVLPKQSASLAEVLDSIVQTRVSMLNAKLVERSEVIIAGRPVATVALLANGIGRAFAMGGRPTIQRFVFFEREQDILMFLASAYEDEFVLRDSEFMAMLETLKL